MNIQIDKHTLERAEERGTNEAEIHDVILHGTKTKAKRNRYAKENVYTFHQERLGKYYQQKKVKVVYTQEEDTIITVTCYVFYGQWSWVMHIIYNAKNDLLYLRFDNTKQPVINQEINEDIVLDRGENDQIVGIEIMDASKNVKLDTLIPCEFEGVIPKPA